MFRRRDIAEITQSPYCDVRVGAVGVVEDVLPDGFAIRIHSNFCNAGTPSTTDAGDRTLFFTSAQLKHPEVKLQDPKLADQLSRLKAELRAKK